jgi:hypothetical protein
VSAWLRAESRRRRGEHGQREDDAPAILIGPDAEEQTDQRAGQDRRADQQPELGVIQPSSAFIFTPISMVKAKVPMIAKIVQTAKEQNLR